LAFGVVEICGDRTGRVWRYHPTVDRLETSGVRYQAKATDDGSLACLHRCEKGGYWDDEFERLEHALDVASLPEVVAASASIRQLIDHAESESTAGELRYLSALWEWADVSLKDFLDQPEENRADAANEVEETVGAALEVLHDAGIVHLDVTPNNILRVDGRWKLADLDSCTQRGAPAIRHPINDVFLHPDREHGVPTRDEFDSYGLEQVLTQLRT
jgi:hypothetical protein